MLRVSFMDGDARRTNGGLSWFGQKKVLRPAGGDVCISLHRDARVGVTSMRERVSSPSLKEKRGKRPLLEMSIFCFVFFVPSSSPPPLNPGLPFYRVRGGQDDEEP
jgi:hypothetical protein